MLTLITGSVAGFVHVLTGPDHLAAVAPLAAVDRRRGWLAGWTWGVGHASGVVAVAALAVLLRGVLPPIETLSAWSERVVGVALIAIGFWAFQRSIRRPPAAAARAHNHTHNEGAVPRRRPRGHARTSFLMGILHGVAGSSHFFGVLPALALPTTNGALLYIGAFGTGTVVAMTAFAAVVGWTGARVDPQSGVHRGMMTATAVLAIVVGCVWLVGPA